MPAKARPRDAGGGAAPGAGRPGIQHGGAKAAGSGSGPAAQSGSKCRARVIIPACRNAQPDTSGRMPNDIISVIIGYQWPGDMVLTRETLIKAEFPAARGGAARMSDVSH